MASSGTNSKTLYSVAYPSSLGYTLTSAWKQMGRNHINRSSSIQVTATLASGGVAFDTSNNNTLKIYWYDNYTGTTTLKATKNVQDLAKNASVSATATFDVKHNADGTLTGYAKAEWTAQSGTGNYIAKSGNVSTTSASLETVYVGGPTTTLTLSSKSYNNIVLNWKSNMASDQIAYRLNGGTWVYVNTAGTAIDVSGGATIAQTISGLSPNTTYNIEAQSRRTVNQVWGPSGTLSVTTNKPSAPNCTAFTYSSVTQNSVIVDFTGGYGTGHPSGVYGTWQYKIGTGSWINCGDPQTISGLSAGTAYTIYGRLVDYYGTGSNERSVSFTTKSVAPTLSSLTVGTVTQNSIAITMSGSYGAGHIGTGTYQYKVGSGSWINSNASVTVSGLVAGTNYTIYGRLVDAYGQASNEKSVTQLTRPVNPTLSTLTITNITINSFDMDMSGSYGAGHPSGLYGKRQYRLNGGSWIETATNLVTITGLTPLTNYKVEARILDYYGQASNVLSKDIVTLADIVEVDLKVNGVWQVGKIYAKKNGAWLKGKNVYVKENGAWKKGK